MNMQVRQTTAINSLQRLNKRNFFFSTESTVKQHAAAAAAVVQQSNDSAGAPDGDELNVIAAVWKHDVELGCEFRCEYDERVKQWHAAGDELRREQRRQYDAERGSDARGGDGRKPAEHPEPAAASAS